MISQQSKIAKHIITALITSLILSSCTSSKLLRSKYSSDTEESRAFIAKNLHPGDRVKIITNDGRQLEFKVREINSEAIIGDKQQVLFSEIARLEKMQRDFGKIGQMIEGTAAIVGIVYLVVVILAFVLLINLINDAGESLETN